MADLGGAINVGGSLLSGFMGSRSAERAADTQSQAAERAIEEQRRQFDLTRGDLAPWRRIGSGAISELEYLLGIAQNPAVSQAQNALANAQARYDNLLAQRTTTTSGLPQGVPTQYYSPGAGGWINEGIPGVTGGEGDDGPGGRAGASYRWPSGQTSAAYTTTTGPSGSDLAAAQQAIADAQNALAAAQGRPWGEDARYGSLMRDFRDTDWQTDPGYQFRLGEGQKAYERSGAARGMSLSGAQAKALQRYGQGFASNEYSNAYNRYAADQARKFGFLSGAAGMGQSSAHQVANLGAQTASNIGNLYTQQGNALAAGQVGASNAWGNALGGISDYYTTQNMLNAFKRSPYAPSTGAGGNFISLRSTGQSRY